MLINRTTDPSILPVAMESAMSVYRNGNPLATNDEVIAAATEIVKATYPNLFKDEEKKPENNAEKEKKEEPKNSNEIVKNTLNTIERLAHVSSKKDNDKEENIPEKNIANIENPQNEVPPYEETSDVTTNPQEQVANMQPVDPSNPARSFFQQYQPQPVHRVDEQPRVAPQPVPDDGTQVGLSNINFNGLVKNPPVYQQPGYIQSIQQGNPQQHVQVAPVENMFDNSVIINNFPKIPLKEIEQLANKNGHSVTFEEYPWNGIITVIVTDQYGKAAIPKCFTIDTGMIIDKRVKLFAACPRINQEQILEFAPVYELYTNAGTGARKNLDTKLVEDIMVAGLGNISKKEMYSENYKSLNRKLALITLPTKGLNKEERNALQDFIVKMDSDGWFDKAISMAPGSRFVFTVNQLDKKAMNNFTLINQGVPMFYGTGALQVNPVFIDVRNGEVSIRTNGNNTIPQQPDPSYN